MCEIRHHSDIKWLNEVKVLVLDSLVDVYVASDEHLVCLIYEFKVVRINRDLHRSILFFSLDELHELWVSIHFALARLAEDQFSPLRAIKLRK